MTRETIHEKVQMIFREVFDDDTICISDNTTAADIEDWDSLMQINLIVAIESEFHIKFNISEVTAMKNVGDMMDSILRKVSE